jgi:ATP P2X receptor
MFCSYPTVKYVQIQDSRLGLARYLLLLVIVFYVGYVEMFAMGGWLEASPVVGVMRFSLQQPTVNNCDPTLPNCDNAFSPPFSMPYCEQYYSNTSSSFEDYPGKVYPCEIYEAVNAQVVTEKSLTVMTRASTVEQHFVCPVKDKGDQTCPRTYNNSGPEHKFYVLQSESFTVLLDHAVTASKICTAKPHIHYACSAESAVYQGRLYSKTEQLCKREHGKGNAFADYRSNTTTDTAPCYVGPNRTRSSQDFFSLDVLLQAAGVLSLDECNQVDDDTDDTTSSSPTKCQTYRDTGATLLLNVFWSDFVNYKGSVEPHYYYSPQLVGRSSYKQYIPFYDHYRDDRTLLNAHGIRLAVLLGGEFHQFSPISFLVTLTTALGLLAVATTIVDSLMLYILPEKERYQEAKYESTEIISSAVQAGLVRVLPPMGGLIGGGSSNAGSNHGDAEAPANTIPSADNLTDPLLPHGN